jgi:hypothetical protein
MLMKQYIGTKRIKAVPMSLGNYNIYRGWELPADECGSDHGFLVEYEGGLLNHPDHKGYISWSPADVFLKTYKATDNLSFGVAIEAMQLGCRVARKGWNGKGIFLRITYPGATSLMTKPYIYIDTVGLETDNPHAPTCRVPWLPSQTDLLASDWVTL